MRSGYPGRRAANPLSISKGLGRPFDSDPSLKSPVRRHPKKINGVAIGWGYMAGAEAKSSSALRHARLRPSSASSVRSRWRSAGQARRNLPLVSPRRVEFGRAGDPRWATSSSRVTRRAGSTSDGRHHQSNGHRGSARNLACVSAPGDLVARGTPADGVISRLRDSAYTGVALLVLRLPSKPRLRPISTPSRHLSSEIPSSARIESFHRVALGFL
jgi:hypothetical protein